MQNCTRKAPNENSISQWIRSTTLPSSKTWNQLIQLKWRLTKLNYHESEPLSPFTRAKRRNPSELNWNLEFNPSNNTEIPIDLTIIRLNQASPRKRREPKRGKTRNSHKKRKVKEKESRKQRSGMRNWRVRGRWRRIRDQTKKQTPKH